MPSQLDAMFAFHQKALDLRTFRTQVLASNIANADTPGYQARDFDFQRALTEATGRRDGTSAPTAGLVRTSASHLAATGAVDGTSAPLQYRTVTQAAADRNTVDLDVERAQFADNAVHFEANLMFISAQVKTMLAAVQG